MSRRLLVLLFVLAMSWMAYQEGAAQARTVTATITVVVRPVLEARADHQEMAFRLPQGSTAEETFGLEIGTNDWPIELHLSLLSVDREDGLSFSCGIRRDGDSAGAFTWIDPLTTSLSPAIRLRTPGWSRYSITIRVIAAVDSHVAAHTSALSIVLRSASGLVLVKEVPILVSIDPTIAPTPPPEGGGAWTAERPGSLPAHASSAASEARAARPTLLLLVTSEGVTQVDSDALPPLR